MDAFDEAQALTEVADRLRLRYPHAEAGEVHAVVSALHRQYDGMPVRAYIPVLVEREARDHLRGLPQQRSAQPAPQPFR